MAQECGRAKAAGAERPDVWDLSGTKFDFVNLNLRQLKGGVGGDKCLGSSSPCSTHSVLAFLTGVIPFTGGRLKTARGGYRLN